MPLELEQPRSAPDDAFRSFQISVVPGIQGLHRAMRAIFDTVLPDGADILVVGAGGGWELQTLGASARGYNLVGVDPSAEMLELARKYVQAESLEARAELVLGAADSLSKDRLFDGATALFVMHFLPDDGSKAAFLESIRERLKLGAPYIHVDVCFDSPATFATLEPVYATHAVLGGLSPELARQVAQKVGAMPVLSEALTRERLQQSGFRVVAPFYRGLWYAGWWAEAA